MFEVSKIAWLVLAPANLLLLALLIVFLALPARRAPRAKRWLGIVVLAMVLIACTPLARWPLTVLEDRFARAALPAQVDGVIVLGGGITPAISLARNEPASAAAAPRLLAFADLARRFPQAKLVFTGGSGDLFHPDQKEAPIARQALGQLGVDVSRVTFEDQARNTWENARFSRDLVKPAPGETWVLVTSAAHMPRAVGTFRALGWNVQPWPVGYWTGGGAYWGFDLLGGLSNLQAGSREWIGLVAYYVQGYTDALLPAPR